MLRQAGCALIRAYQRYLSPRKGYRCAYGVLHGSGTCSSIGLRMMEQDGMWAFLLGMPQQFRACHHAAAVLQENREEEEQGQEQRKKAKRSEDSCFDGALGAVGEGGMDCCGQAIALQAGEILAEIACCACSSA